ncbi:MAG: hypothetical protein HS108_00365 [Planctomycetes bacterium]|jgi:tetratricopeptide (TPR) repeat protein|nr:hypothetical protein [Planctomycetota bacterium]MCL4731438.1 hypothetical protein [Planctomycetota bacterium]
MDFDTLIQQGWARHDKDSAALAADLEANSALAADAPKTVTFLALASHTIGFHMKDWPRARKLAETVVTRLNAEPAASPAWGGLAIAQFMAGDETAALASECRAVELTDGDPVAALARTRVLLAGELIEAGRLEEGARLYHAVLNLARAQDRKLGSDRAVAVTSNNLANNLLELPARTPEQDKLMLAAAEAALEFWLKAGTWENEERAEYLLALVHNKLGRPDDALAHAGRGLEVIAANGEEVVDEAFLNLAAAAAYRLKGDQNSHNRALARADELAQGFADQGLKDWFMAERARVTA